jgi:uncharacterized protein DUF6915
MSHTYHHAVSSARLYGGRAEDYQKIHDWLDQSKESFGDFRHRAVRHHAEGIFECEQKFGVTIKVRLKRRVGNRKWRRVPTRLVAEQHIKEDCGGLIPSRKDWLGRIVPAPWMSRGYTIKGIEPARKREFAAADAHVARRRS